MDTTKARADVAVFVDFENAYVSVREKFDAQPNFELIMDRCEDYGRIVIARAYADWYRYPRVTSALFANGVEPMYVPTYYYDRDVGRTGRPIKNSVDIHLCIDVMKTLYSQPHIDKFVLVTGDRDFIPLVNAVRQQGKDVIVIGIGGAASSHLAQSADEFLFYEQIADLKPPQQQRQENRSETRRERGDGNGRGDSKPEGKRDRGEANGKPETAPRAETAPEPVAPEAPAPAAPVADSGDAPQRPYFDTLVEAINVARQRGFVSNLGSLKVLMRELDSTFNESKAKDSNGKPFSKFKDFVKDAERQGKVQIFTNGTVTEVFLVGEDPLRVSQFADELAEQQAERELENELDQQASAAEAEQNAAETSTSTDAQPAEAPSDPSDASEDAASSSTATEFSERDWKIFRSSMLQFAEPVRFADIFSALRSLRNQELFDLPNNDIKELVKQAINRGMLQRTGRGARAFYRLSSQHRQQIEQEQGHAQSDDSAAETTALADEETPASGAQVDTAAGLAAGDGQAAQARTRRRRKNTYDVSATPVADATPVDTAMPEIQDVVAAEMDTQAAGDAAKPRRNRRRKPAADATAPDTTEAAPEPAETAPVAAADAEAAPKKRTRRRRKPAANGDTTDETAS